MILPFSCFYNLLGTLTYCYFLINEHNDKNHLTTSSAKTTSNFKPVTTTRNQITSSSTYTANFENCPHGFSGPTCSDECGLKNNPQNLKIVGGQVAAEHSYNSIILIHVSSVYGTSQCGAILISRKHALSAGHCFKGDLKHISVKLYLGVHDFNMRNFKTITSKKVIIHENYNTNTAKHYDIALIVFDEPIEFTDKIQPACLPDINKPDYPPANIPIYLAGWGDTSWQGSTSDVLKNSKATVLDNSKCHIYGPHFYKQKSLQICIGSNDGSSACQGDSGGPAYVRDKINGKDKLVAAGVASYVGSGCSHESPNVYVRIGPFLAWIFENVRNN